MYLKSLEVQGFKSFANKIVFEFHNGITGIVGPNGSGKSNVADAVRWVLGEQSAKQLRGASMQDVIFAGTENRKPLGYAYVAITLDNSDHSLAIDFNEVTVARRVYRSGESEYLINGNPCRLKEVSELFYDTGIGKEGYSIIGQGQIDRILSGKPEERRELFDEAAGIVKFKKRKLTAQKKLDNERENLVRVNDILTELERQVGPLQRQSEKAHTYLKKREELKNYDVNMFLLESARIESELKAADEKYAIADDELKETNATYESIKAEYERLGNDMQQMDERIESLRESITSTSSTRQKLENQIELLKEQIHTAEMTDEHLQSRLLAIEKEKAERLKSRKEYDDKKAALEAEIEQMKQLGIKNVMALRGDLTPELEKTDPSTWDYKHATELVRELKETGDFCIGVACYPEVHPESINQKDDLLHIKDKVDAGADFLTTQMVFDNNLFFNFMYKIREIGVTVPVIPGIMPITNGCCSVAHMMMEPSEEAAAPIAGAQSMLRPAPTISVTAGVTRMSIFVSPETSLPHSVAIIAMI